MQREICFHPDETQDLKAILRARNAKLACGHVVPVDHYVRGKHVRRACPECGRGER